MQRPDFRYPANTAGLLPRPGGFRSPPPGFVGGQGGMFSPPRGFAGGPPSPFGPRFGQYCGSPNSPPGEFRGSNNSFNRGGGSSGKTWQHGASPGQYTPRTPYANHRGNSPRQSPFQSPSPRHSGYQGSPRNSTPFRSPHGRERVADNVEKYYKPSMLQDPWADREPVSVTDVQQKCGKPQATNTGRQGRYYN
ncbi:M-phase-specific PLK1-interacting protein [Clupea harengus]|uniref:M-phase-specific PLK1-interacting protein n=1 Tax=Clupea harengus TaxID=7950 RepID=A0A6P3VXD1_CLUHA|nr:M-phase-specific PLK1-interacting protein [Clupea harengus]